MKEKILQIQKDFEEKCQNVKTQEEIENLRLEFIGKKGYITLLMQDFRNVPNDQKREVGMLVNELKQKVELGVNDLKFHGLRHSFATRCIESKCDYKTVSVILGHSNISTTLNLYVHPNLEQKKKCINQMFKFLK